MRRPLRAQARTLFFLHAFDIGRTLDQALLDKLVERASSALGGLALRYVTLYDVEQLTSKGWKLAGEGTTWIKPMYKPLEAEPVDPDELEHVKRRAMIDVALLSDAYLERSEIARMSIGKIAVLAGEVLEGAQGFVDLLLHRSGVFVLTVSLKLPSAEVPAKELVKLKMAIEVEEVEVEIPRAVHEVWVNLHRGSRPGNAMVRGQVKVKARIKDVAEMYATFIKYLVQELDGKPPSSMMELENKLRNPWDLSYTIIASEIQVPVKAKHREVLKWYSSQVFSAFHSYRRVITRSRLRGTLKRTLKYMPLLKGMESEVPRARVAVLISDVDAHIVLMVGGEEPEAPRERILYAYLSTLELVCQLYHCLRVYEYMFTHYRPKNLDELAELRMEYSWILDHLDNAYFLVDKDMCELFRCCVETFELRRISTSIERKYDSLSYTILTRYQERISKMQVLLTVLFGVSALPFSLFFYFQWYFDVVVAGRSQHFLEVTLATYLPVIPIVALILYLYRKWQKEVFT